MSNRESETSPDCDNGPVGHFDFITIDVKDMARAERFWSGVLGTKAIERKGQYVWLGRQEGATGVILQQVPDTKVCKNRVHPDFTVDDLDVAVAQMQALGGRKLQEVEEHGFHFIVMADPDGNEFCLVTGY